MNNQNLEAVNKFSKISHLKFHDNPFIISLVVTHVQTDMAMLSGIFWQHLLVNIQNDDHFFCVRGNKCVL